MSLKPSILNSFVAFFFDPKYDKKVLEKVCYLEARYKDSFRGKLCFATIPIILELSRDTQNVEVCKDMKAVVI